jgi:hypothetical protein
VKLNIAVKERKDQSRWDCLGKVTKELQREIKSRNFKNEDSLEMSFDSLCIDVSMRLGINFDIIDGEYIFDFTNLWSNRNETQVNH